MKALGLLVGAPTTANKTDHLATDSFDKAADAARAWMESCDQGVSPKTATVTEACKAYVLSLEQEGRKTVLRMRQAVRAWFIRRH